MQSFFEQRPQRFDTSLPSVRHVQQLIRSRTIVRLHVMGGQEVEGTIQWQDSQFLAVRQDETLPLLLINRAAIALLRALV